MVVYHQHLAFGKWRSGPAALVENNGPIHAVCVHTFSFGGRVDTGTFGEMVDCDPVFWVAEVKQRFVQ
jgi:hypothetical protein